MCVHGWEGCQPEHPSKEHLEVLDTTSTTLSSTGDLLSRAHAAYLPPQAGFLSLLEIPGEGRVSEAIPVLQAMHFQPCPRALRLFP